MCMENNIEVIQNPLMIQHSYIDNLFTTFVMRKVIVLFSFYVILPKN